MHFGGDKGRNFVRVGIYFVCLVKADLVFCIWLLLGVLGTPSPILLVPPITYCVSSKGCYMSYLVLLIYMCVFDCYPVGLGSPSSVGGLLET